MSSEDNRTTLWEDQASCVPVTHFKQRGGSLFSAASKGFFSFSFSRAQCLTLAIRKRGVKGKRDGYGSGRVQNVNGEPIPDSPRGIPLFGDGFGAKSLPTGS